MVQPPPAHEPTASATQGVRSEVPAGRRQRILQLLQARGSVSVAELERAFAVSGMTIRRDLQALEQEGFARRAYGGAVLTGPAAQEGSFEQRLHESAEAKSRLAHAAADLISDGDTVFVDSSTAAYYTVRHLLAAGRELTLITNSLPVIEAASTTTLTTVVALGGTYQPFGRCFVGPDTTRAARARHAHKALVSAWPLLRDGRLSMADPVDAEVKHIMIDQSTESILLISSTAAPSGRSIVSNLPDITHVLTADISDHDINRIRSFTPEVRPV
jgi:DeoR/GlpR family transcriptional regulator of sugar metabolism